MGAVPGPQNRAAFSPAPQRCRASGTAEALEQVERLCACLLPAPEAQRKLARRLHAGLSLPKSSESRRDGAHRRSSLWPGPEDPPHLCSFPRPPRKTVDYFSTSYTPITSAFAQRIAIFRFSRESRQTSVLMFVTVWATHPRAIDPKTSPFYCRNTFAGEQSIFRGNRAGHGPGAPQGYSPRLLIG